ncbi:MAG TPA: FAD-dependent oxidoreductase [Symbiobacteriaceae bacterium]|nr:FAD-dependent oxidoreductase [Symbiobacteriaceae bacterium]
MSRLQASLDRLGRLPVAIIGGGVSGLYAGWRLRQAHPYQSVAIFEESGRTGGRLLTWLPYGKQGGLRAELGGMRFFPQQELVWNLVKHLKLPLIDFPVDGPNLLWYLRGLRMSAGNAEAAGLRYALNQDERGKLPYDLLRLAIDLVLNTPENRAVLQQQLGKAQPETRAEWDAVKPALTYQGTPLWYRGFWNILTDVFSFEGYHYTTDTFGYYSLTSNWNAAEALQAISLDFTQKPAYKTLVEGYEQLPTTLRQRFEALGGHLFENCSFLRFERRQDGSFVLAFQDESGEEAFLIADRIILALPRRALELIEPTNTFNAQSLALKPLIDAVQSYPAFKLFLLYSHRWWESARGIIQGRSVSDLPIRQTYYFRPDQSAQQNSTDPAYGLLMASYDDVWAVDYWRGMGVPVAELAKTSQEFRRMLEKIPIEDARGGVATTLPPVTLLQQANSAMLARAKEQLALLHGLNPSDIPDPIVGAYTDWTHDPYGGGWSFWQPQVNVKEIMPKVRQPLGENLPVYIIGDTYSGLQGWVEGALSSAEIVLQQGFWLDRPEWLPVDYYLGW